MKKISKETWFIIIISPIVLGILGFMFFSDSSSNIPVEEESKEKIVQENLLSKLDENQEDNDIDQVMNKQNRQKIIKRENEKYSINEDDHYSERSIWDDTYKKRRNENEEIEEIEEIEEKVIPTSQPKVIYVERKSKSSSKSKKQENQVSTVISTSSSEPQYKRKTAINSSFSSQGNIKSSEFIHAVIHNKQEVHAGGEVKIRTTEETIINNIIVPANTYMSGISEFKNDRILIRIKSFELYGGKIIYTNLIVYDKGVIGVYIPGGVNQEIATDAASNTLSQSSSTFNIPVIGSITTSGGNKKINDKSVILTEGYKILLKQEPEKD